VTSHPRFDFARFADLFSLPNVRAMAENHVYLRPAGQFITSPYHLTVVELLRREVFGASPPSRGIPTDAFVFAAGEPPAPYLTKFGGAPFRPRSRPWPTTKDGRALAFVAQLAFVDSRDIVAELPGDVLLVFFDAEDRYSNRSFRFEWVGLDESDVVLASEMPRAHYTWTPSRKRREAGEVAAIRPFELFVCHGVIHRTFDLPGERALFAAYERSWQIAELEATKIGGSPRAGQRTPNVAERFLGSIASVQVAASVPFPWVNQPEATSPRDIHRLGTWMFGDMGSLNLFERAGKIRLDGQFY
jgi:hypothetical protein